jgi:hypothetical protein
MKSAIIDDVEKHGKLNGIVHCAGLLYIASLKIISEGMSQKIYKVNAYSGLELAKLFISKKIVTIQPGFNSNIVIPYNTRSYGIFDCLAIKTD